MNDPYFQQLFADRIGGAGYGKGTEIYKFEKIKRAKRQALAEHPERRLIDFGIGENDAMADPLVRARMKEEIDRPENRGYADNGIQAFKDAAAAFMKRQFGVELDPATEVNHAIGSKPALAMLPACFINPGDVTLMTVPGYPVAGTHTRYCGGEVHRLPLREENGFLPDLDTVPSEVRRRAKLLVLNYPNSPTGAVAGEAFFRRVIEFARENDLVVVHDAAHLLLTYEGRPLSFLAVPGAKEVGVEVHSLSKGFNMIGWRIGWVCGHERIVRAFADVKDNCDSGQFIAIQKAAVTALEHPEIADATRAKYRRRLEKLIETLKSVGWGGATGSAASGEGATGGLSASVPTTGRQAAGAALRMPGGTYFLYVRAPKGVHGGPAFETAEAAAQYLITQHSIVTVPWDDAGAYLRFSVTYEAADDAAEDELMEETARRFDVARLLF
ncbi:MAG: aminotransferase class I/II-fold pyridoxal phosphate-dependent enzyme [Planctomycetes bacterium]|nr:aminotransferase class I/II-fold pyridoxal phosphate-dependent enzyme [Planctomycetota bacterium]